MSNELLDSIRKAILKYDRKATADLAHKAIASGIEPIVLVDALTGAMKEIGDAFGRGELWLPELVGGAAAMTAAMPMIEAEIKKRGETKSSQGKVVIGTVLGDIHSIGKDLVATLLVANGFEVYDLGVNVSADRFIQAIKDTNPDILAMSALLTTTAPEQRKVIENLKEEGLTNKVKTMVGGGAITEEFRKRIGADGYSATAVGAVEVARSLVGK